jgi:hypothetical protein
MSTKIYNGFIIRDKTFNEVKKIFNELKTELMLFVKEELNKEMAETYYEILDDVSANVIESNNVLELFENEKEKKLKSLKNGCREPSIDFGATVTLKENNGYVYGVIFVEKESIKKKIIEKSGLCNYEYYNNSEAEDFTKTEWRRREQKWNELFGGFNTYKEAGFEDVIILNTEEIIENFKMDYNVLEDYSYDIRKRIYIKNKTCEYIFNESIRKEPEKEFKTSNFIKISQNYRNGMYKKESLLVEDFFDKNHVNVSKDNYKILKVMEKKIE